MAYPSPGSTSGAAERSDYFDSDLIWLILVPEVQPYPHIDALLKQYLTHLCQNNISPLDLQSVGVREIWMCDPIFLQWGNGIIYSNMPCNHFKSQINGL
jgi:hypothetical protein